MELVQALAHGPRARERTEVAPRLVARAAMETEARKFLLGRKIDVGKALLVAQQDVVARLERLDQLVLEQQRLGFGPRDRHLDRRHLAQHARDARLELRALEIAPDPLAQVLRLADVEHLPGRIQHAVHAGLGAQGLGVGLAVEGRGGGGAHPPIIPSRGYGRRYSPIGTRRVTAFAVSGRTTYSPIGTRRIAPFAESRRTTSCALVFAIHSDPAADEMPPGSWNL